MSVFVCLSVRSHNSTAERRQIFLCVLLAQSSSGGVAIRCVLTVLWMTSCFRIMVPVGENQARRHV